MDVSGNRKHVQVWQDEQGRGWYCLVYANGKRGPHQSLDDLGLARFAAIRDFPELEIVERQPEE